MYPEEKSFVLEPGRIRRILRKLLGKVSDLEEEVLLRPSVYKSNDTIAGSSLQPQANGSSNRNSNRRNSSSSSSGGGGGGEFSDSLRSSSHGHCCSKTMVRGRERETGMPPAHPFQHLLAKGSRRAPKYTYRRSKMSSLSESEYTDTEDGNIQSGAKRGRPKALSRSSSLGALSDGNISQSSSQDPALWLTTPRKRLRRRASETHGAGDAEKARPGVQPQSFSSRLEKMVTNSGSACANTYKARSLHSHLVGLGELLWLGCPSSSDRCAVRVLPLKVLAAFRLGEAVAVSDGCSDLDYLDEVYGAMPVFLVRFALWQHIITMCYMRIPAYADTLSEALWDVGAFEQQQWLIGARLVDLDTVGALLKPGCIVPLHLRAVDIGAESWFVTRLLKCLSSGGAASNKEETEDAMHGRGEQHSLWREFALPGTASLGNGVDATYGYSRIHGSINGVMPSRFSKWVARISNPAQSVRLLATALEQALLFLVALGESSCSAYTAEISLAYVDRASGISCHEAVETVKAISSIVYTKLGCLDLALSGSNALVVLQCLQRCVLLLDKVTCVCQGGQQRFDAGIVEICAACQTGLVLLALRQLGASRAKQPICSYSSISQMWTQVSSSARKLFQHAIDCRPEHCGMENVDRNIDPSASKRSMLVAQFDSAIDSSHELKRSCAVERKYRLLEMALQHLVLAGASPGFFHDVAQLVAYDLKRPRAAKTIVAQALLRFDAIWDQHRECRGWQQNWTRLQAAADYAAPTGAAELHKGALSVPASAQEKDFKESETPDTPMDEPELWEQGEVAARSRLRKLSNDLDKHLASKAADSRRRSSMKVKAKQAAKDPAVRMGNVQSRSDVAEDELGLMLSLRLDNLPPATPEPAAKFYITVMFDSTPEVTRDSQSSPIPSAIVSDDEYFDCKSHMSSANPSLDSNAPPAANNSKRSSCDTHTDIATASPRPAGAGNEGAGRKPADDSTKTQRFRSLTNSQVFPGSRNNTTYRHSTLYSTPGFGSPTVAVSRSSSLRRAATATAMPTAKAAVSQGLLVEERARRAVKAMAEACTTGVSVREADEKRSRAFSRLLVEHRLGSPGRNETTHSANHSGRLSDKRTRKGTPPTSPKVKHSTIHLASSHNSVTDRTRSDYQSDAGSDDVAARNDSQAPASSATPEPESRALSLTDDKKAIGLARSASLEARVDQHTRAALSKWIVCFGSVHFDVDQGPTLNLLYPYVPFSDTERAAICFSSMPDSTIYELYDSVYTFHFRVDPVRLGLPKDTVFLYGHVFFRQKRDPLMRRGGFQRSVAIISHLPYHGLFSRMAHMLGPMYFDLGTAILEAAAQNVSSWKQPVPGKAYELPFLGTALSVELPAIDASQLLETSKFPLDRFDPGEHILASVTYDGLFRSFRDTLDDLWTCWELMILGESLVVLADTPSRCSEAIVSLVDIIFPIRYCGDYRPYFTIQDPDFRAIVSKTHVPNNTVVGVSNPFFSEALSHWPHKLFLGSSGRMSQMHGATARKARAFGEGVGGGGGASSDIIGTNGVKTKASSSSIGSTNSSIGGGGKPLVGASSGAGGAVGSGKPGVGGKGIRQGLQTKHKCAVNKDRPFVEHLLSAIKTGRETPWMVNNMLRRYFIDLTVQFLAPLDRYFSTLIPKVQSAMAIPRGSQAQQSQQQQQQSVLSLSWFSPPGALRPWRMDDFMESLVSFGISPQLSSRHSATTAAEVFASVFSGSSTGSGSGHPAHASNGSSGSSGSNSSRLANGQREDAALRRRQYDIAEQQQQQQQQQTAETSSFSLWKSKKGTKRVSDEWMQLYGQFLKCGNFATWLAHRTSEAQRALVARFRQEVCQGDVHAWCRGYDYTLGLDDEQLAAEMEALELATMDLGQSSRSGAARPQPHADHIFYHGEEEEERRRAERHRQRILHEQQQRLAGTGRPVYGSDGTLVGFAQVPVQVQQQQRQNIRASASRKPTTAAAGANKQHQGKQLGQRITQARRAQTIVLQAAWLTTQLLGGCASDKVPPQVQSQAATANIGGVGDCPPPGNAETTQLLQQLSVLVEYMPPETGRMFLPLVGGDYTALGSGPQDE
ncbi:hypothetical protein IW140_003453 [Coemansia sp. RSA 1813]|nr:hypothetical protein EV178_000853 [Coemansia sp. RSA 1646]KAJ2568947.1 hypothetical protein IW140_003453 [Coemansia sp. RSA 1813]